jgi:hypothetical protein
MTNMLSAKELMTKIAKVEGERGVQGNEGA